MAEECIFLFFGLCGRHDSNSDTEDVLEVFVGCFRENRVLADTDSEVTHIVYRRSRETAEVARARKCDVDELIEEVIHASPAQRHLVTHNVAFAHLELCDRRLCSTRSCLLAGDTRETCFYERLAVL